MNSFCHVPKLYNYTYDLNGNLVSSQCGTNTVTYTYTPFGMLASVTDSSTQSVTTYTYDGNNLRLTKTVTKTGEAPSTTKFIYDGTSLVAEIQDSGDQISYINANGVSGISIPSGNYILSKNIFHNVEKLINGSRETVSNMGYDAFGNQTVLSGTVLCHLGYRGEYQDAESGLIYLRNRYYDPSIGRFITEDPHWNVKNMIYGDEQNIISSNIVENKKNYFAQYGIKKEILSETNILRSTPERKKRIPDLNIITQNSNLYIYCGNNPVKYLDTTGNSYTLAWGGSTWWIAGVDGPLPIGDAIVVGGVVVGVVVDGVTILFSKKSKSSDKDKASDIPSWAKGEKPKEGESGNDFARRLMDEKYGKGNYKTGPGSEYNKLRKYGDRGAKQ